VRVSTVMSLHPTNASRRFASPVDMPITGSNGKMETTFASRAFNYLLRRFSFVSVPQSVIPESTTSNFGILSLSSLI